MFKRILSALLVLATLFSFLPPKASAAESGSAQVEKSVAVEGTNSFGSLMANTMEEDPQSQSEDSENRICDLVIDGTSATVEYAAAVNAKVVVAVYTEDGSQMLGSGTADVTPEDTRADVDIQIDSMPRYFSAAAYLLDAGTNDPLSPVFRTQLYTKAVQDIQNSTVEDYDPERVLNLDDSSTTNFAVFSERTILVQEDSPCRITGGNGVYTVTNPDEKFLAMEPGDSFAVTQENGELLIVSAARVEVKDNTVIIYENVDADLQDVFEAVKVEGYSTPDNVSYDDSTLDPELSVISEEEFLAETGDANDVATYALVDKDKSTKLSKDFKTDGDVLTAAFELELNASTKLYISSEYQYITVNTDYSIAGKLSAKLKISKEFPLGSFKLRVCTGVYVTITPKVYLSASCELTYKLSLETSIGKRYDSNTGVWEDTSSPLKVSSALELSGSVYVGIGAKLGLYVFSEGIVYVTVEVKVGATISAKEKIDEPLTNAKSSVHPCDWCLDGKIDGSIKGELNFSVFKRKHPAEKFEYSWKISDVYYCKDEDEFGFTKCPHRLYRVGAKVLDTSGEPVNDVWLRIYDAYNAPIEEVYSVHDSYLIKGDTPDDTNESGESVFYLPNGSYRLDAAAGSLKSTKNFEIHGEATSFTVELAVQSGEPTLVLNQQSLALDAGSEQQLTAFFGGHQVTSACAWTSSDLGVAVVESGRVTALASGDTIITADYVKNGTRYSVECAVTVQSNNILASGQCGDNLTWQITDDKILKISGYGDMWDYEYYWSDDNKQIITAPWYTYGPKELILDDRITHIGNGAFADCQYIKELRLPDQLRNIGNYAFYYCRNLTGSLSIPDGVTVIGHHAFFACAALSGNLELPSALNTIGDAAFEGCGFTGPLKLPAGLRSVGDSAFHLCTGFTGSLELPGSLTSIGNWAFAHCEGLTGDLAIHPNLTIGMFAFEGCGELTLTLQEGITSIDNSAFAIEGSEHGPGFTGNLKLPNSLIGIKPGAFAWNSNLTGTLVIPNSVEDISVCAFEGCGFDTVVLSNQMDTISSSAFSCCENLTGIHIPTSVTKIESEAFYRSGKLKDIWYAGTEEQWNQISIDTEGNDPLLNATIHYSSSTVSTFSSTGGTEPAVSTPETVPETTEATVPETTGETIPEGFYIAPDGARPEDGILVQSAMHTGQETVKDGVRTVAFTGLEPGEEYVLIVSLKPGSVASADLQYIEQAAASDTGRVQFAYIPRTDVSALPQLYGIPAQREITLDREYLLMTAGDSPEPLKAAVTPEEWADEAVWSSENTEIAEVDSQGWVTPIAAGTTYIAATVTHGKYVLSARCRVDVTEKLPNEEVLGVDLGSKKVTSELYSTDYAELDVLLRVAQNEPQIATFAAVPENNGAAITGAYLVNEDAQRYFDLRVKDDRHLLLVPTREALEADAKQIKGSYTSTLAVQVNGVEYHTADAVTINVKKSLPKLKAAALTFNSFYTGQSQALNVTGGTVTKIEKDTQAKGYSWPDWLELDGTCLTLKNAPDSGSANLNLLVYTAEWSVPVSLKVSAKLSRKAPAVKLSASRVTLSDSASLGTVLKLTAGKRSLEALQVRSVTLPDGFRETALDMTTGEFQLVPEGDVPTGKLAVKVQFYGTDAELSLPLTVSTKAPALKLSKSSVSLNGALGDAIALKITAVPADLDLTKVTIQNPHEALTVSDVDANGEFTVAVEKGAPPKSSYVLNLQAPTGKAAKLTVKTLAANQKVSMSLKASGSIDPTYPEKGVTLIPSLKNYSGTLDNVYYSLVLKQGRDTVPAVFDDYLRIGEDGQLYCVGGLTDGMTAIVAMTGELPDGSKISASTQIKVKQTAIPLKLSKTSLSLNKKLNEWCTVDVSTTARGYNLGTPNIRVVDNKGNPTDALTAAYESGTLRVALSDKAQYGTAYKVQLWVTPNKISVLTVKVPAEKSSDVTVTAKASGGIDVIRDSTEIVITPSYKNYLGQAELPRSAIIKYAEDGKNFAQDMTEKFQLIWADDGKLHIKKAGDLDLSGKYRLELTVGDSVTPAIAALTIKSGSAKFKTSPVLLYANDVNSRAELKISCTDRTQNPISRLELKDVKLGKTYAVDDLGNGVFTIRFQKDAVKKDGSVALNVFCQGNSGTVPNATVTVKLEVR